MVLGRDTGRWLPPWRNTLAEAVGVLGKDLDVMQIALPARESIGWRAKASTTVADAPQRPLAWRPYAMSALICAVAALAAYPLLPVFELANIVMVFLLAASCRARGRGRCSPRS